MWNKTNIIYSFNPILLTDIFATDLRWSNSTIISKNDTFVFEFSYCWIVLIFLLLCHILHVISLSGVLFCTDVILHFLQPEANSFTFVVKGIYICKKITFYIKNKQALPRFKKYLNSNVTHYFPEIVTNEISYFFRE